MPPAAAALQRLEFEGLLVSRPRAGTRVRVPSPADVLEHFVVREALETAAAMRAALTASAVELKRLEALAHRVDELGVKGDVKLYSSLHRRFHRGIAAASHCAALQDAVDQCLAFTALWLTHNRQPFPTGPNTLHQEIVEAISSRDAGKAAEAVRKHLAAANAHAVEALPSPAPRLAWRLVRKRPQNRRPAYRPGQEAR